MNNLIIRWSVLASVLALVWTNAAPAQQRSSAPALRAATAPARSRGPYVVNAPFGSMLVSQQNFISPFASFVTPGAQPSSSDELRSYFQSTNRARLLDVPEMFGDFRRGGPSVTITPSLISFPSLQSEFPVAAAISGLRAGENNHTLPSNRAWVAYNYFESAFDVNTGGLVSSSAAQSLHRTTAGVELLIDEGQTSVELRMPFGSAFSRSFTGIGNVNVGSASVGNLNVLLKRLLYADGGGAVSAGLGIETPTGSEGVITYNNITAILDPRATHFVPFVAVAQRGERWFGQGFMQLDVASHGDRLSATLNAPGAAVLAGRIDQPPLLGLDLGGGYWLLPPEEPSGSGLAIVGEVHYTTPLGNSDSFVSSGSLASVGVNSSGDAAYDVLHFTAGLQAALGSGWRIRPAVVVPAKRERVFDAEYLLQINRSF